jgi:integrase
LQREAASEAKRRSWIKVELALVLVEATGRRIGAVQQLRWEDVDFDKGVIRWRQDADKQGIERRMPMPSSLVEELRSFQRRLGAVGGPLFARSWQGDRLIHTRTLAQLLVEAEQKADLPKLPGGVWHPYRRKWATERKHLPVIDVAQAGGWSDTQTLLTCYQQPDHETLLAVVSEPRKVRERGVG